MVSDRGEVERACDGDRVAGAMFQSLALREAIDIIGDRSDAHGKRIARERCVDMKVAPENLVLTLDTGCNDLSLTGLVDMG